MNKQIQELYEQARLQAKTINADCDPQQWMDEYHKKFVELIVRECALQCNHNDDMDRILEHFGVEQ
jgi:hypothetical protein